MPPLSSTVSAIALSLVLLTGSPLPGATGAAAYAQTATRADSAMTEAVERAFRGGDADRLLKGAANRVDVVIFGKGTSYSRTQAALVLQDFFRRNPPARVEFGQEVLAEDRRSMIGHYWVEGDDGEPVAVSVRLRARKKGWQVRGIRIERQNGGR